MLAVNNNSLLRTSKGSINSKCFQKEQTPHVLNPFRKNLIQPIVMDKHFWTKGYLKQRNIIL